MASKRQYFVYILSNDNRTLYIGVTNDLLRRVQDHKDGRASQFTTTYGLTILVHFESYQYINNAIAREKQLKGWRRARKLALVDKSITIDPSQAQDDKSWF